MYKACFKVAFIIGVIVGIAAFNSWYINGPLLKHNIDVSMKQLKGDGALTTAGNDIPLGEGYAISFPTLYILQAIIVALLTVLLFLGDIFGRKPEKKDWSWSAMTWLSDKSDP